MAAQPIFSPTTHFWDSTTHVYATVAIIYNRGASYGQEDVVCHAWAAICEIYFPEAAVHETAPRWTTYRESSRIVAVKLIEVALLQPNLYLPTINSRDYLWINCKPATADIPSGWKDALAEVVVPLDIAHPSRVVHLIIAVGFKCAYFLWDPAGYLPRPRIFIRQAVNNQAWQVDPRVKSFANSRFIHPVTGEFDPAKALTLECFRPVVQDGAMALANQRDLDGIEQFLVNIHNSAVAGFKPAVF